MSKASLNLDARGFQAKLQGREVIKCLQVPVCQQLQHTLCNASPVPIWQGRVLWQCSALLLQERTGFWWMPFHKCART